MRIRIRWKAAIPAAGILIAALTDKNVIGTLSPHLPAKWAHALLVASALAAVFAPAFATNRPKSGTSESAPADPVTPPAPAPNDASNDFARGE